MRLKNQGFSLISVMVAAVVGLVIMTALTQQMVNQTKTVHRMESKMESLSLRHELTMLLANDPNCDRALDAIPVNLTHTAGGTSTDILAAITTGTGVPVNLVKALKDNYSNNRLINVTGVSLIKPYLKVGGADNNGTLPANQYEFKLQMTVAERGSSGSVMLVESPIIILKTTGAGTSGITNAPDACGAPSSCLAGEIMTGITASGTAICAANANTGNYGGSYTTRDGGCYGRNPKTGGCSCPAGFGAYGTGLLGNISPGWTQITFCIK